MNNKRLEKLAIAFRARFDRGKSWLNWSSPTFLAAVITMFGVYKIDLVYLIPVGFLVIAGIVMIGYVDYKRGIWLEEARYHSYTLNPAFKELYDKIDFIYKKSGGGLNGADNK
jgi:hypothetical protein